MSGKSCFLKAMGIIVFLAHLGSFVPAEAAVVGLTDRLFSRMAAHRTAAPLQSSFMSDLSQMAAMLHSATHRHACASCHAALEPASVLLQLCKASTSQRFADAYSR